MEFETPLCEIAFRHRADKCPQLRHHYTPYYYELLKDKQQSIKKVLEFGIGYPALMRRIPQYKKGASLYMWREFFPNAQIYGADIKPETLFQEERISTYLCDERKKEDVEQLIATIGGDIDLVVDDASHFNHDQIFLFQTLMPLLTKQDVIYVIEDSLNSRIIMRKLRDYHCECPDLVGRAYSREKLIIITRK